MSIKNCCQLAIITAAVATLMACGGGGGGTENQVTDLTPAKSTPPPPIHTYAKERSQSLGLGRINAEAAYDRGWTGEGVTIGYYEIVIRLPPGTKRKAGRQSLRRDRARKLYQCSIYTR